MSSYVGPRPSDVPVGTIGTQTVTANSIVVGSNVTVNSSTISVGNSTVNSVVNSSGFFNNGLGITPYNFRNKIINGDMRVAQRGTSVTIGTSPTYFVDRFAGMYSVSVTGTMTQQSSGGPTGYQYYARMQRTSGQTATGNMSLIQVLETLNSIELAGQTITLSFYARAGANYSSSGNALFIGLYTGTGTDQSSSSFMAGTWTSQTLVGSSSKTLTTSWQQFSVTVNVPSSSTQIGILFQAGLTGTAGTNDYFDITGVQLEVGSVATPFERRPYGMELQLCQRYFQKSYNIDVAPGTATTVGMSQLETSAASTYLYQGTRFPVIMRANPTITGYNDAGTAGKLESSAGTQNFQVQHAGMSGFSGGLTAGTSTVWIRYNYKAEIEL